MQAFGIGGAYAYFSTEERTRNIFLRWLNILLPLSLILHFYWSFSLDGGHFNYWYRTVDSIISIWLIHKTIVAKPGFTKQYILENPILMKIGQISYGLYLYHYALPYVDRMIIRKVFAGQPSAENILQTPAIFHLVNVVVLLVVALVSFHYFEKPIMKLKRYFEYKDHRPKRDGKPNEIYQIAD